MPTYEYQCEACGERFEKFQSITAAPIKKCPKCGKRKVKRLIGTGAGILFKGSGFYITDYRDKSYTDKAKAETTASGGGDSKSSEAKPADTKSTETKPAATAESKPSAPTKPESQSSKKSKK